MGSPHILALPYLGQGHVIPLMELCHCLVDRGFKVTFVNTEYNHARLVAALPPEQIDGQGERRMELVSIPDGLDPDEDRDDMGTLVKGMLKVMPGCLEELIRKINDTEEGNKVNWMIADETMSWAFAVAKKFGVRTAAFYPASAAAMAMLRSIPRLIEDEFIDENGAPKKQERIELSPGMPPLKPSEFIWNCFDDPKARLNFFHYVSANTKTATEHAEFFLCNTFRELESPALSIMPNVLPIGPLFTQHRIGSFWHEDASCVAWLDEQPPSSVIYVAFGSTVPLGQHQLEELALGLELTGRPFLWILRSDIVIGKSDHGFPDGFRERVASQGRIVGWSPQHKVLAHPSVACFVSHCGWNSTMEGIKNGVPFLCWPYFVDQILNKRNICDVWRTGLSMDPDENGIVSKEQIREKVEAVFGDEGIRSRALMWKDMAEKSIGEGGSSFENLSMFIKVLRG